MAAIPAKAFDRLVRGLKRYQPILRAARDKDAGEADTSTIVKELLSDMFGYDKFAEITSEHMIKGTFCDIAIKLEDRVQVLIEVKAIGLGLKDAHVRQAVNYAANQGVQWVFLTNGAVWRIYRIFFRQPISEELVYECDLLSISPKSRAQVENVFLFSKEGLSKLDDFEQTQKATSRYYLGAFVLSEPVLRVIRKEVRRIFPEVRPIDTGQLRSKLEEEVLKREVTEGEKADEARKRVGKPQKSKSKGKPTVNGAPRPEILGDPVPGLE
ncbi:MAG: type I restriction enzyme HsdR N-terminal domain-containing protein [Bryobacterales bacterium]|nr:type I restriction enzyme HsdR N-terminal domain-containing protein [Bryobacterales bacterium]